jgi:hypothetical protein
LTAYQSIPPAPSQQFLLGIPNRMDVSWYRFFTNISLLATNLTTAQGDITIIENNMTSQSISLVVPTWLTVSGSPVTGGSGTFTVTSTSESANEFLASPSGSAGALSPRAIVGADLPDPSATTLGGVLSLAPTPHEFVTSISTVGQPVTAQPASTDLSDTVAPTTFAPTDQSGAGLTFTSVSVRYTKVGNIVSVYGTLTYPSTVSASTAAISLPVAVPNQAYASVPGSLLVTLDTGSTILAVQNTSTATFYGAGGALTNANLSLKMLQFFLSYPAS